MVYDFARMKLSVVMPAFNERHTSKRIIGLVLAVRLEGLEKERVIVDDGAPDGARDVVRECEGRRS